MPTNNETSNNNVNNMLLTVGTAAINRLIDDKLNCDLKCQLDRIEIKLEELMNVNGIEIPPGSERPNNQQ